MVLFLSLFAALSFGAQYGFKVSVGMSPSAWSVYRSVKNTKNNFPATLETLRGNYGTYQESFGGLEIFGEKFSLGTATWISLAAKAEASGTGRVQNPVLPQIKASFLSAALLNPKVEMLFRDINVLGRVGLVYGQGRETRIEGFLTDFIEGTPRRKASFKMYGADLELDHSYQISNALRHQNFFVSRLTYYDSSIALNPFFLGEPYPRNKTVRYRWRSNVLWAPSTGDLVPNEVGPALVIGPQPLPLEILPRIWEYTHEANPSPELGNLVGFGLVARWLWEQTQLVSHLGLYAGHPGGLLAIKWKDWSLDASVLRIEESSVYRTRSQEMHIAQLGYRF